MPGDQSVGPWQYYEKVYSKKYINTWIMSSFVSVHFLYLMILLYAAEMKKE